MILNSICSTSGQRPWNARHTQIPLAAKPPVVFALWLYRVCDSGEAVPAAQPMATIASYNVNKIPKISVTMWYCTMSCSFGWTLIQNRLLALTNRNESEVSLGDNTGICINL